MSQRSENKEGQVYVGNLPPDVKTRHVEDLFYKYGKINFINLKEKNTPPFAFIEFDDPRDAEDAIKDKDGYNFEGYTLRVEHPRGERSRTSRYDSLSREGPGFGRGASGAGRGRTGHTSQKRSNYRIIVSGLPPSGSWQDLKDHLREAGDIVYADTYGDGTGIVEFLRADDMKYAVKKLDDTKFKSHEGETAYIRIKENYRQSSRSRSRSRSDSYNKSR